MKILSSSIAFLLLLASPAHATESEFLQNTAHEIFATLQAKADALNTNELAAFALLKSHRDHDANAEENSAAENLLKQSFTAAFVQADHVQLPVQTREPIFGNPKRDVYTFCPEGSEVKRHPAQTPGLVNPGKLENVWGYSYCVSVSDSARVQTVIRIQDLWISNWKHPMLTLLMVGGDQINLDIDLNRLMSGKVTEAQILKKLANSH